MQRFNLADPTFEYELEDPPGYHAGCFRFGEPAGALATGASLYLLPPGETICPYHYEVEEEEWVLVLEGRLTLRHPGGEDQLQPLDAVFFPPGPDGAHKLTNATDEPARVLMWSSIAKTAVCVYPDSDKVGVYVKGQGDASGLYRRSTRVEYFDDEPV